MNPVRVEILLKKLGGSLATPSSEAITKKF